ncbi:MAG: HEAT repeat domain-containing protein [Leptolyngbya sp. SIO4C5]|uniref:HEAT repeat domain-containing protein n=1 Tax=Sphaerothrix gracilis TaxID=3151835 RepID=UPI0013BFFFF5|nr:HEAT repeat domain-containing protein [Leptolyngbya sp. SIO4C5]
MANTQVLKLIRAVDEAASPDQLIKAVRALSQSGTEAVIPTLITVLGYNNPGASVAAVEGLVKLDSVAVPFLLEQIQENTNYSARAWAIRALAGIGDPQGLETLLTAAIDDFSMSVRRAAARGLGILRWQMLVPEKLISGQEQALGVLFQAVEKDPEWVVRYAAVVGLQEFAAAVFVRHPNWLIKIQNQLGQIAQADANLAVKTRALLAQQRIQPSLEEIQLKIADVDATESNHWQLTLERLYSRKAQERCQEEGNPYKFRAVAAAIQDMLGEQTR